MTSKKADLINPSLANIQTTEIGYSGPLPHPQLLAGYETVLPGLANRIVTLAENEATHRHLLDKALIRLDFTQILIGQFFGLMIGIIAIFCGTYIALHTQDAWIGSIAGSLIGGSGVAGIISVFIFKQKEKNL